MALRNRYVQADFDSTTDRQAIVHFIHPRIRLLPTLARMEVSNTFENSARSL